MRPVNFKALAAIYHAHADARRYIRVMYSICGISSIMAGAMGAGMVTSSNPSGTPGKYLKEYLHWTFQLDITKLPERLIATPAKPFLSKERPKAIYEAAVTALEQSLYLIRYSWRTIKGYKNCFREFIRYYDETRHGTMGENMSSSPGSSGTMTKPGQRKSAGHKLTNTSYTS